VHFLRLCTSYTDDLAEEAQRDPGERVIAVEHRLAVGDVGDRVKTGILLDLHADGEAFAVALGGLDAQQIGVVLAEGILGIELDPHRLARGLALERTLERREQLAVPAVQVGEIRRVLDLHALGVMQLDAQGDDGVAAYERRRLTRSNTSMASPRGLMP